MVPVLSKAKLLTWANFSSVVPVLTMIPLRLARLIPETKAMGAARINGHGEATTKTSATRTGSPDSHQASPAIT